jgi:hypothetical protein
VRVQPPDPADIRRELARGRGLTIALDPSLAMPEATAVARNLRSALGADVAVFASPMAGGPVVRVLQLVGEADASAVRPALERLVAEFRAVAGALVERSNALEDPEEVQHDGGTWSLFPHGEHCRFENDATGVVVEADIHDPGRIDSYFLLEYAQTTGRHDAVVDLCVEGFHDMCRLLDVAGVGYR